MPAEIAMLAYAHGPYVPEDAAGVVI